MTEPGDTCTVPGWDRSHTCGKPVERDGVCGTHAAFMDARTRRQRDAVRAACDETGPLVPSLCQELLDAVCARDALRARADALWEAHSKMFDSPGAQDVVEDLASAAEEKLARQTDEVRRLMSAVGLKVVSL